MNVYTNIWYKKKYCILYKKYLKIIVKNAKLHQYLFNKKKRLNKPITVIISAIITFLFIL